jgi:hypothetical protein
MKIRNLVEHWEQDAGGRLTSARYQIRLDLVSAARLMALAEMYPKRHPEQILGELIGAALDELVSSLPYVKGSHVVATDEEGDPVYEDIGPTPRFLMLSRKYLQELEQQEPPSNP